MGWLKRIAAWLFGWRHDYVPTTSLFLPLDIRKIAADLELIKHGTERGRRNEPPQDAIAFDNFEQRVVSLIESERNYCHDRAIRELGAYDQKLTTFAFLSRIGEVEAASQTATAQLDALRRQGDNEIRPLAERVVSTRKDLERFQKRNRLDRTPNYPDSNIFRYSLLLLMIGIETVANGRFVAPSVEGLAEGLLIAFTISLINVGLGFVLGNFSRFINHRSLALKLLPVIAICVFFVFIVAINLAVAHFRDVAHAQETVDAWRGLKDRFQELNLSRPETYNVIFHIQDFISWILFVLGFGFAIVALADGYTMDDPYPGYGAVSRGAKRAEEEFNHQYAQIADDAEEVRATASAEITNLLEIAESEMARYRAITDARERLISSYNSYLQHLQQAGRELLSIYRDANRTSRKLPTPAHFDAPWILSTGPSLAGQELPTSLSVDAVQTKIRSSLDKVTVQRGKIMKEYADTMSAFRGLSGLIGEVRPHAEANIAG